MFDRNVVIKKYVWAGEENYSILLFGGEHKFFTKTHGMEEHLVGAREKRIDISFSD